MILSRFGRTRVLIASAVVVAAAGTLALIVLRKQRQPDSPPPRYDLSDARARFRAGQFAGAEEAAKSVLDRRPDSVPALLIAADSAVKLKRYPEAVAYFDRVPEDAGVDYIQAQFGAGEVLSMNLCRLSDAETRLRRVLQRDPRHSAANFRLAYILGITGRSWEAAPFVLVLAQKDLPVVPHMYLLGDFDRVVRSDGHLERCRQAAPDDALPLLGLARIEFGAQRAREAHRLLTSVVARRPDLLEAHAQLGETLMLTGRSAELMEWHARLPPTADRHPHVWVVRGLWCRQLGRTQAAVRCFLEAVRLEPNHRRANYQLGQLLQLSGRSELAARFLKRAEQLQQLSSAFDAFQNHGRSQSPDVESIRRIVALAESLGRLWEARWWTVMALRTHPRLPWATETLRRLQPLLTKDLPQTHPANNPSVSLNLALFRLPRWRDLAASGTPEGAKSIPDGGFRFHDRAEELGIRFEYFNAGNTKSSGARIFETTGGGVAAVDYDGDGWPDLYFTQGAPRPEAGRPHGYRDRLYRNLRGERFDDVSQLAGLGDERFSQGVSVGDYDGDGFPDIYVANLGINRLYHNNGDGTFDDVGQKAGIVSSDWTTSCLVADLNGDGLPDIYDVNYIAGNDLSRLCSRGGVSTTCSPLAFSAAQDRVLLNRGDGRFEDVTRAAGIERPNGYGLGIVAADFRGIGRLDLFVANDQTANFLFVNRSRSGTEIVFEERALPAGVAFDGDGKAQASMGVAVGDADGDGRLDLFVTNFYKESNTLYRGQPGGGFVDETRRANLRGASLFQLGFGTQFLDADLDGRPDIVVTNGHVENHLKFGEPYHMRPQCFRNLGRGRFAEVAAESLGGYFQRKWLGRGLARVDWNRDGRDDFVVSHIQAPASLVTNETPTRNHFLAIFLRGTACSRDAVGTRVRIRMGRRETMGQLTAGDGYMAGNERKLIFGIGASTGVDELEIRWPGGRKQVFRNPSIDAELLVIEGNDRLFPLSRD